MTEQEKFENWLHKEELCLSLEKDESGKYCDCEVSILWKCWQASRAPENLYNCKPLFPPAEEKMEWVPWYD